MFDSLTLFPAPMSQVAPADPRPLIVDSFAGGGGASTGIELALGRSPDIAINHSESALALHAANHPETLHLSENVYRVDPLHHMHGRHIGLMWFSPDCKHFSKAKGGAPVKRNIRDLAWIIPGWIERIQKSGGRVDVVLVENVEEFKTWGPLIDTDRGLIPDPTRSAETFQAWCKALRKLGGKIETRELRACDYGAPTIRKRLFVVVRFDRQRIVWPKPTHGAPDSPDVRAGKLLPWRTAAECIDWSLPCPSIFDTAPQIMAKHGLRAQRPLADNTLARVARGMKRYVLEADRPFIVNLTHGGRLEDAAEPFRTITAAHRGEKAVVAPALATFYGHGGGRGTRAADLQQPLRTVTVENRHALIAPTLANVANGKTTGRGPNAWPITDALRTITGANGHALVTPYLASIAHGYSGGRREYPLTDPLGTVTVGGIQHAVLAPFMATMRNSQKPWQGADEPTHTVTAGGAGLTLIAPVLTYAQQGGGTRPASDPHHTICASRKDQNSLIAATMVHIGNGERHGQQPRALDIEAPLNTVVASGVRQYPVAAFLAQQNGGPRMEAHSGRDAREPISTVTGSGSHQTPVAAFFAKYYGTGDGARSDEPCHTITVKDRMGHIQADLAAPPFGPEHHDRARQVVEFLRAHGAWDGGKYVTISINGQDFVVVDIGMRMLTPRELFNAQGFPADYVIEGVWTGTDTEHPKWRPFPGHVQVSCCGNSVCPPLAEALVRANCSHLAVEQIRGAA